MIFSKGIYKVKAESEKTVMTLSNAIALSTELIREVAGTEVSDTLNGNVLSRTMVDDIVASNINRHFATYTQSAKV